MTSVYMPTSDHERLQLETLTELEASHDEDLGDTFIRADFSVVMDPKLDRIGYVNPHVNNRAQLLLFLDRYDLTDVWRVQNSKARAFSSSRGHKHADNWDLYICSSNLPGCHFRYAPSFLFFF